MKNTIYKSIFALTFILVGIGCGSDFLEKSPTNVINVDDVGFSGDKNPAIFDATLTGIYTMTFTTGTGGDGGHDDFGQKGYDIFTDMLSSDLALAVSTYGWYSTFTQYLNTVDYTSNDNYMPWRYYYRVIRSANLVIKAAGGNDAVLSTPEAKYAMGQAKAMRAYAYFYLTQLFINEYNPTSKVLPIYDNPDVPNQPQSTTEEVYNFIIKDFTEAIALMNGFNRAGKFQMNQNVARGYLAYTYAAMGTTAANAMAKQLAEDVINSGEFTMMSAAEMTGGFNDIATSGWMWGIDLTGDTGLGLVSWWGQMDVYTYSYQWAGDRKAIDQGLFDQISANDVRKAQFFNNPASGYHLIPWNKFYHPGKSIGGQRTVTTDYVYMRVSEMYLMAAEMAAKSGDDAGARTRLKQLLAQRFANAADYAYVDALSGQALVDEIYLQTRIEFFAEGKSYLAMKRNAATTVRGTNHLSHVGTAIPYNDDRLTYEIPQQEVQNNPHINN